MGRHEWLTRRKHALSGLLKDLPFALTLLQAAHMGADEQFRSCRFARRMAMGRELKHLTPHSHNQERQLGGPGEAIFGAAQRAIRDLQCKNNDGGVSWLTSDH